MIIVYDIIYNIVPISLGAIQLRGERRGVLKEHLEISLLLRKFEREEKGYMLWPKNSKRLDLGVQRMERS